MATKKVTETPAVPAKLHETKLTTTPVSTMDLIAGDLEAGKTGFENIRPEDVSIPFIIILQALSPQLRGPDKLASAVEGDFFNTVSRQVIERPITVVPCAFQHAWVEWVPREKGGGFVKQHLTDEILKTCVRNDKNQDMLSNGNIITSTAYYYVLLLNDNSTWERAMLSFVSTQLKKARRWNAQMLALQLVDGDRRLTPPMFSHSYTATSVPETNDRGSWAGWKIENPELLTDRNIYTAARQFNREITAGLVKVTVPPEDDMHVGTQVAPSASQDINNIL